MSNRRKSINSRYFCSKFVLAAKREQYNTKNSIPSYPGFG